MRTAVCAALLVGLFAASSAYGAGARQITTRGSFLKYRANSAQELAKMVERDSQLGSRYASHFNRTKQGLVGYFGDYLKLVRLKKATTTNVYYYRNGKIASNKRVMPAGTLVFATLNNKPILDWRCGNPLSASLPAVDAIMVAEKKKKSIAGAGSAAAKGSATFVAKVKGLTQDSVANATEVAAATPDPNNIVEKVLALPPAEITPAVAAATSAAPMAVTPGAPVALASLPPIVGAVATPSLGAVGVAPIISGSRGFNWLMPLAALGGATAFRQNNPPVDEPTQTTPEPRSIMSLAVGASAACMTVLKRRKRQVA